MWMGSLRLIVIAVWFVSALLSNLVPSLIVHAATITVRTTQDTVDSGGCSAPSQPCSLRDAITFTNANGGGTINVPHGYYQLQHGHLLVEQNTALYGNGSTIDGGGTDGVFAFSSNGGQLSSLSSFVITNGNTSGGGGINSIRTDLTITSCVITGNKALSGGGISLSGGVVTIQNSTISGNRATANTLSPANRDGGGGIYYDGYGFNGTIIIQNSSISGNTATIGGGFLSYYATTSSITVMNSTISGNSATNNGGGFYNTTSNNAIELTNVTISGNHAGGYGGGIYTDDKVRLTNVTVANNTPTGLASLNGGNITLRNTLLADSYPNTDCTGNGITSQGNNLSGDGSCGLVQSGDQQNTNAALGPLAGNGGPTQTHALPANSAAVDHGNNAVCPTTDQRGMPRPSGSVCDVGAYEYQVIPNVAPALHPAGSFIGAPVAPVPQPHPTAPVAGLPVTKPQPHSDLPISAPNNQPVRH